MARPKMELSLRGVIFTVLALLATVVTVFMGLILFVRDYGHFQDRLELLREQYIQSQKEMIKTEVIDATEHIEYMLSRSEKRLKETIKSRTLEAHALATHIFNQYKNKKSSEEINKIIIETIRIIRFSHGRGYYFSTRHDGVELLFADKPEIEGKNLIDLKNSQNKYPIRDMIKISKEQGEGFYRYSWSKPFSEGNEYPKISYIKYFEPLDGYIGTGGYLDDIEKDIKQEVLERISKIRFGKDGYIFVVNYDGVTLMNDVQPYLIGQNLWNMTDPYGIKVIQQERLAVQNPEGDYINYHWEKPPTGKVSPKVSFLKGIPQLKWMVGAGVYLDEVESIVEQNEVAKIKEALADLIIASILFISILGIILLISYYISHYFDRPIDIFISFFKAMEQGGKPIATDPLRIKELKLLARSANSMLAKRIEAEEALRESEERYRNFVNNASEGIYRIDFSRKIRIDIPEIELMHQIDQYAIIGEVNEAFSRMYGLLPEQMVGKPASDFAQNYGARVLLVLESPQHQINEVETVDQDKDGKNIYLAKNFSAVVENGILVRIWGMQRDITARKIADEERVKLESQLQQAQKMESVGRLAGGVAHDFNNLLTGITGNLQLAKMDLSYNDPIHETLDEINEAATRAATLTKQLLAFSRKQIIEPKILNLNALIDNMRKMLVRIIGEDIDLTTIPMNDLGKIKADPGQVEQIILNLAVNARDAMPQGGKLTIETVNVRLDKDYCKSHPLVEPGYYVMMAISDNGEGIDENTLKNIFDPFFTTKREGQGTGLGLSTVYGIVKQHKGNIEVYSEQQNGTTFKIYFPLVQEKEDLINKPAVPEVLPKGTETILIVEDEAIVRNIAIKILQRLGYNVLFASDGPNALILARDKGSRIDLLLTDVIMPNMNGRELAENLQQKFPHLKVLFTSGYTEEVIAHHGILDEGLEFIGKPYSPQTLAVKIRQTLDN